MSEKPPSLIHNEVTYHATESGQYAAGSNILTKEQEHVAIQGAVEGHARTSLADNVGRLEQEKAAAESYKEKHGSFPQNYNPKIMEEKIQQANAALTGWDKSYEEPKNGGCITALVVAGVVGTVAIVGGGWLKDQFSPKHDNSPSWSVNPPGTRSYPSGVSRQAPPETEIDKSSVLGNVTLVTKMDLHESSLLGSDVIGTVPKNTCADVLAGPYSNGMTRIYFKTGHNKQSVGWVQDTGIKEGCAPAP